MLSQYLAAKAMEGAYGCSLLKAGYKRRDPPPHLVSGLVGEGQGEHAEVLFAGRVE